jgi:Methyltransferase domain
MASVGPLLGRIVPGWTGVEIGVCRGHSARALLEHGCGFLFLVDPWEHYDGVEGFGSVAADEGARRQEANFRAFRDNLAPYDDGRHFALLRMPSAEAARLVPEVDFVWVDGNHRYEWVRSDLEYYWPKVRPGGLLCGDDFTDNDDCQVGRAVAEFARARGLEVQFALPCWVIRKGGG